MSTPLAHSINIMAGTQAGVCVARGHLCRLPAKICTVLVGIKEKAKKRR
ncbi:hypothetical protein [uncultured Bartonella sp.]|nr:hypothetical protein [uncultured Bartonella sp.]